MISIYVLYIHLLSLIRFNTKIRSSKPVFQSQQIYYVLEISRNVSNLSHYNITINVFKLKLRQPNFY